MVAYGIDYEQGPGVCARTQPPALCLEAQQPTQQAPHRSLRRAVADITLETAFRSTATTSVVGAKGIALMSINLRVGF